jgi:putative glutamine transport system substrate-binding protein
MKKIASLFLPAAFLLFLAACDASPTRSQQVQAIRDRGILRAAVKADVPNFSYINAGAAEPEGFEVDMVRLIAKEILGDESRVQFIPVTSPFRGPVLDNDQADMVIANFTITEERKGQYNFTSPYYTDEVGLLVRQDSGIKSLADMNGRIVGISRSSTSRAAFQVEADKLGMEVEFAVFSSYPEVKAALLSGKVDAFVNDKIVLRGYSDERTVVLEESFSPQPFGIATKLENDKLAGYLDTIVTAMRDDGRLDALAAKWGL